MATVRCPLSGEQIEIERWVDDESGDSWVCPDCKGDISLDGSRRLRHATGQWITCPVNKEKVFVWTGEDEDYECDHCAGSIEVRGGKARHESIDLVECPAFAGETSLVFLGSDEDYECDHCKAMIYVSDGEARHEEVQDIVCAQYPGKHVVVPLEEDDSLACPFCGADIEIAGAGAVHPRPRTPLSQERSGNRDSIRDRASLGTKFHRGSLSRRVFVSYSTRDIDYVVNTLVPRLRQAGHRPWFSLDGIHAADTWERSISKALEDSEWFIVVMSPNAVQSDWVRTEVHWAIENRPGRIIPIMLRQCEPWKLHMRLGVVQYIANPNEDGLERLITLLAPRRTDAQYEHEA
jgi:uncharacterized protein YbaR (Trm112 family)